MESWCFQWLHPWNLKVLDILGVIRINICKRKKEKYGYHGWQPTAHHKRESKSETPVGVKGAKLRGFKSSGGVSWVEILINFGK